jgi:hypothetical protein
MVIGSEADQVVGHRGDHGKASEACSLSVMVRLWQWAVKVTIRAVWVSCTRTQRQSAARGQARRHGMEGSDWCHSGAVSAAMLGFLYSAETTSGCSMRSRGQRTQLGDVDDQRVRTVCPHMGPTLRWSVSLRMVCDKSIMFLQRQEAVVPGNIWPPGPYIKLPPANGQFVVRAPR